MPESDIEKAIWEAAGTLPIVGPWVKIAHRLRDAVGGDTDKALQAIRAAEKMAEADIDRQLDE